MPAQDHGRVSAPTAPPMLRCLPSPAEHGPLHVPHTPRNRLPLRGGLCTCRNRAPPAPGLRQRQLNCTGFLVLLQHVSPKLDFAIPVVSFLNACKGERRSVVHSPLSNRTAQRAAGGSTWGARPQRCPRHAVVRGSGAPGAGSQLSAWDPTIPWS